MKVSCDVVKDLLPLYHDNVCSIDSCRLIEEHIEKCEECKNELEAYDIEIKGVNNIDEVGLLKGISKKWKRDKKTSFLKGIATISSVGSILSIILYNLNGSYVDENGYLVEAFGFIPLAYFFGLIFLISVIILVVKRITERNSII